MAPNLTRNDTLTTDGCRTADLWWIILLWVLIYIPGLGSLEFKGEETRRVLPAVEMLQKGDYLVPYIGGEPYYNKPPMINWLVAASFKICGVQNEFSARLPSVAMILFFVLLLMKLPGVWPDHSTRFYTAIIFLTNVGMMGKGRLIEIEAVYVCFTGMAVLWWLAGWVNGWRAWQLWLGAALPLTLAMLTKGPAHLLFFYAVAAGVAVAQKRLRALFCLPHAGALVIIFGFAGLWYSAAAQQVGDHLGGNLAGQFFHRLFDVQYEAGNLFFSLFQSLINFSPWILFVPILWSRKRVQAFSGNEKTFYWGLFRGTMASFAIICLVPGTVGRYSMPVIPIVSLLLGWVISRQKGGPAGKNLARYSELDDDGGYDAGGGRFDICLGANRRLFSGLLGTVPLVVALLFGRNMRQNPQVGPIAELMRQTSMVVCALIMQYSLFNPVVAIGFENRRPVAAEINQWVGPEETLYVYKPGHQPFLFYVRQPLRYIITPELIDTRVHYLMVKESDWRELEKIPAIQARGFGVVDDFAFRQKNEFKLIQFKGKQ